MLLAPGMDAKQQGAAAAARAEAPKPVARSSSGKIVGIIVGVIVLAAVAFAALRYLGMI
jgi:hypothetical protein